MKLGEGFDSKGSTIRLGGEIERDSSISWAEIESAHTAIDNDNAAEIGIFMSTFRFVLPNNFSFGYIRLAHNHILLFSYLENLRQNDQKSETVISSAARNLWH
uniref:Uncharacterized protein n=1 Tax=Candidatus Kentrum sp. LPFa TaxID=2126335 RepID=A0A450W4N2_9GAMM|nr:MAG: hypothetical protein BECKLPF1236A_GA0070988_100638 [Candidatus Kentron sp. LPFa]VFK28018.1 MAG: hypothetical protein BECKLPF1236C_GA0070990_100568 [Candidatus Kentron sp. LPFa]